MRQILHVEQVSADRLYWPELDIDLSIAAILHPEQFPLLSRLPA